MKELGDKVFRRPRIDVVDDQIEAELDAASDEMATTIQAKIDDVKGRIGDESDALGRRGADARRPRPSSPSPPPPTI